MILHNKAGRPGTVVPLLAMAMVCLVGFLALAIDIGMLAIAKTQAQNTTDLAALTAARTLNGNSASTYNNATATTNAQAIVAFNNILGTSIQSSQLTLTYGSYDYNQTTQSFNANYPPTSGVPWTAVTASITSSSVPGAFSNVFGVQFMPSVTGSAQAVHRPRDVALVADLSASMRFGTCLGFDFYTTARASNNPDTNVPTFAQYSGGNAATYLIGSSTAQTSNDDNYTITPSNTTATNSSYSLTYINSFYQSAAYATTLVRAFDSYTSTDNGKTWSAPASGATPQLPPTSYATTPGGDVPLFQSGSTTTYAQTLNQVLNYGSSNTGPSNTIGYLWQLDGYSAYAGGKPDTSGTGSVPQVWLQADYSAPATPPVNGSLPFNGWTKGPGYYGKRFFLWPPDPRTTVALSNTTSGGNLSPLQAYLFALGISNTKVGAQTQTDVVTLSNAWATWQGQGASGLTYLQNWLNGQTGSNITGASFPAGYNSTHGYYSYSASTPVYVGGSSTITWSGSSVTSPLTYYAVCRLFNRAYPGGAAWTSTSFSADWRMRFFGTTNDNTVIFNSNGSVNPPGSSGMWPSASSSAAATLLTYNAILSWLTTTTDPFPPMMRSGRIKYYGTIPTSITGTWPSYGDTGTSHDQQFWVEVIDHMLGFRQTSSASYTDLTGNQNSTNQIIGYGGDITWGTETTNSVPSVSGTTLPPYMNYKDNPLRPLLRLWFSPILMVDYLQNCNMYENTSPYGASINTGWYFMQPGNSYEAPLYVMKQAYSAAITTMQNNHPNDWFSLMMYSQPRANATDPGGRFNCVSCPLGTNYNYAQSSLLFPFSTINADGSCNSTEVTPYDTDPSTGATPSSTFVDTPRSGGDTCFAMGLMLAFNQFAVTPSSDTTLRTYVTNTPIAFPTGMAGGLGRNGAQKVVIFETDGMPNCQASTPGTTGLVSTGSGSSKYSYFPIRYNMNAPSTSEYPSVSPQSSSNSTSTVTQITNLVTTMQTTYGTTRNPFRLYAMGFGPVFSGTDATQATATLLTMQNTANLTTLSSLPTNQIITGTDTTMSANMISAFTSILENGVQIALIQ